MYNNKQCFVVDRLSLNINPAGTSLSEKALFDVLSRGSGKRLILRFRSVANRRSNLDYQSIDKGRMGLWV
jgi:hypothetical protein